MIACKLSDEYLHNIIMNAAGLCGFCSCKCTTGLLTWHRVGKGCQQHTGMSKRLINDGVQWGISAYMHPMNVAVLGLCTFCSCTTGLLCTCTMQPTRLSGMMMVHIVWIILRGLQRNLYISPRNQWKSIEMSNKASTYHNLH